VGPIAIQSNWWTTIDTPDKNTIVLKSDLPRPGVFDFLWLFNVVDKNTMEGPDAKTKANGTGPFKFVEWVVGDHVTMAKNPSYWQSGLPYLDGINTRIFKDAQAMVVSLESGALDQIDSPPLQDLIRLQGDPKYQQLVLLTSGQFMIMVANGTVEPTNNKQFRQAINYAINRQRFVDTVYKAVRNQAQDLPFPPGSPAYDETRNKRYTYDLDKAKSLLQPSGVSKTDIELVYSNTTFGDINQSLAQILQADLKTIGINCSLRPVDFPTQFQVATERSYNGLLLSAGGFAHLPEASASLTRSRFTSPDAKASFTGVTSDQYQQLINQASIEPDATKRKVLYGQIEDIILDESAAMAISLYPQTAMVTTNVHDLTYDPRPGLVYTTAWLE
jgi:peptide/nickel transport system substrate-binding protein